MRFALASSLAFLVTLAACGGTPPAKEPVDLEVASGPAGSPAALARAPRAPSKEIAARWPFAKQPDVVAYGDLAGLASSELARSVAPVVLGSKDVPEAARKCGQAILSTAKEVLVGAGDERDVMIVRVAGGDIEAACVASLDGAKPIAIAGATSAHRLSGSKGEVLAFQPGFVLVGSPELVEAVAGGKTRGPAPSISLGPDQIFAVVGRERGVSFRGGLTMSAERFRAAAEVTLPSEKEAAEIDTVIGGLRGKASQGVGEELGASADERKLLERLVKAVGVSRNGATLSVAFDLEEKPADQARDLGATGALAVSGVRRYLIRAKQAEARNMLGQIARDLVIYWDREDPGPDGRIVSRASKKLFSVPATPKVIPRGAKYQSSREDWTPWARLRFEMSSPQYFQYELRAAKDGESADIIARGDLNGDGKPSMFVLHVSVKRPADVIVVAPSIAETDPDE